MLKAILGGLIGSALLAGASNLSAQDVPVPWPGAAWHVEHTDQNCLYYFGGVFDDKYLARLRRSQSIVWQGSPCTPGKLINGTGVLVEVGDLMFTSGRPGKSINRFAGTMVNGMWDGFWTQSDDYPGSDPHTYPAQEFRMGCPVRPDPSDPNRICRPPLAAVPR